MFYMWASLGLHSFCLGQMKASVCVPLPDMGSIESLSSNRNQETCKKVFASFGPVSGHQKDFWFWNGECLYQATHTYTLRHIKSSIFDSFAEEPRPRLGAGPVLVSVCCCYHQSSLPPKWMNKLSLPSLPAGRWSGAPVQEDVGCLSDEAFNDTLCGG